jgi:hypothetical protein
MIGVFGSFKSFLLIRRLRRLRQHMNQISTTATINPTPNAEVTAMAAISAWLRPLGAPEFGMVVGASVGLEVTSSAILEDVALPSAEAPLAAANA